MSEPPHDSPHAAQGAQAPRGAESEELDAVIVAAEGELEPYRGGPLSVRARIAPAQLALAASIAASGFLAGATVIGIVHRRGQRTLTRGSRRRAGGRELPQIVASRSLLVDVHLLGGPGRRS